MAPEYKPPEYKRQMDAQLIQELRAQREEHNRYYERFDRILDIMSDLLQENKQHMKRYEKQEEAIFGKNGLVIEVDRLMQDNKKSKWFWALSIAAFLQAVITAILKSLGMKFIFAIVLLLSFDLVFAQTSCLWCPSSPLLDRVMVGNGGRWQSKLLPSNCDIQWDPVTREFVCGSGGGAPANATYVVMSLDATLTNERVLTAGTGIDITDGGAGGNATILLEPINPQTVLGNPLGGSASPQPVGVTGGLAISGGNLIIDNNGVTDAKLRDSIATSVIGRAPNSAGDPADIQGTIDGESLQRSAGAIRFGPVDLANANSVVGVLPAGNFEGYDRVQEESSNLTRRRTINFLGSIMTCADNAGTSATDCTLTAPSSTLLNGTTTTDTTNSAVTRGDLIIGNSTPAWDDLAIGAAHTVLTSDGTDPSWQTAIPIPSILDPTLGTFLFDDFIANVQLTSQITSALGWDKYLGSGTIQNGNSQDNVTSAPPNSQFHPGVIRLQTSTSASGRAAIALGATGTTSGMFTCSGGVTVVEWLFQMYDLSSAAQRFRINLGMGNEWSSNTLTGDAGFWIEYSDNANSGKFEYKYFASGGTVTIDSGLTAVADTWYKVRFVTNANWSEVTYTINGANSQTAAPGANVLTTSDSVSPGAKIVKSVGVTGRELVIDYFRAYQIFSTPRE